MSSPRAALRGARGRIVPPPGPLRTLAAGTLVNSTGSGLLVATVVLYFTREVGLSGGQVALGLTLGGLAGLLAGVPLGHLSDVRDARSLLLALVLLQALATVLLVVASSPLAFAGAMCVFGGLRDGASAVRQGVTARVLPAEGAVRARAFLRAMTNVGFAVGTALATVGIALDSAGVYRGMIALDALSFVAAAAIATRLPRVGGTPREPGGPRLVVLRDRPYLLVIALTAGLAVHNAILDVGLPLWVSTHTDAPPLVVGVVFVVNCVAVAVLSVPMAARGETPTGAARAALRSGVTLVGCCALLAVSGSLAPALAAIVIVVGMLFQALAETQQAASQWGLSLGLAPDRHHGQYQGAASTGLALGTLLGPLAMAGTVALGPAGWLAFAALMLLVGAVTIPATRYALR